MICIFSLWLFHYNQWAFYLLKLCQPQVPAVVEVLVLEERQLATQVEIVGQVPVVELEQVVGLDPELQLVVLGELLLEVWLATEELEFWRNPIKLKLRDAILFSGEKFIDVYVVEIVPHVLFFMRKIFKMAIFTAE
jgi:hypothetical protein